MSHMQKLTVLPFTYLNITRHAKNVKTKNYCFLNNQSDILIIQILFCYKTLHVSGNLFAHYQEFSTVHSALVSFMQVLGFL
jgi:hypothetical protein